MGYGPFRITSTRYLHVTIRRVIPESGIAAGRPRRRRIVFYVPELSQRIIIADVFSRCQTIRSTTSTGIAIICGICRNIRLERRHGVNSTAISLRAAAADARHSRVGRFTPMIPRADGTDKRAKIVINLQKNGRMVAPPKTSTATDSDTMTGGNDVFIHTLC